MLSLRAVNPRAAVFFRGQRIAHGVDDFARLNAARGHFPQLFHADAIGLRVAVFHQIELLDELLGQRSARAFGEHDDFRFHVIAGLEIRFLLVLFVDALVVGAHAGDAIAVVEQFRSGKARENRDPRLFDFARQPLHEPVDRDDVVAVILQRRRRERKLVMAGARQKVNAFFVDHGVERGFAFESGQQFFHRARIEQRAGEAVLSGFARFFEHVDIFFAELRFGMARVVVVDQLRKPQRAGHARRAAADDDDIGRHFRMFDVGERLAEDQHGAFALSGCYSSCRTGGGRTANPLHRDSAQRIRDRQLLTGSNGSRIFHFFVPWHGTGSLRRSIVVYAVFCAFAEQSAAVSLQVDVSGQRASRHHAVTWIFSRITFWPVCAFPVSSRLASSSNSIASRRFSRASSRVSP